MSAVGQKTLKTFKTVFFGDYAAKRLGNTVFVAGKDGSKQVMEIKEFMKFLAEKVPVVKSQPAKDTFVKGAEKLSDDLIRAI